MKVPVAQVAQGRRTASRSRPLSQHPGRAFSGDFRGGESVLHSGSMDNTVVRDNIEVLSGCAPEDVWREFAALSAIPRCSKQEAEARAYVVRRAEELGLEHESDEVGNLVLRKPAAAGRENRATVVLQGHLDMVCEKNTETEHDFATEGIRFRRDGDWLRAVGTTLGADNGVAVAAMLAVLSGDYAHGPLEALFTVDEETGLTGASGLDPKLIKGRVLLNLDSEEEGAFTIGCAGGINTRGELPARLQAPPSGGQAVRIAVRGLAGGHSGIEINKGLGNAVSIAGRLLLRLSERCGLRLAELRGGEKHNAIPRECFATAVLDGGALEEAERIVGEFESEVQNEYRAIDPKVRVVLERLEALPKHALEPEQSLTVARLLRAVPHGVLAMSAEVPGLVESSTNFAAVELAEGVLRILTSQRSSVASRVREGSERVRSAIELAGGKAETNDGYAPWEPNPESQLLATASRVYAEREGRDPEIGVIHAGLECGVIGSKLEGMDMLSFGPDIRGAHSPDERVSISSTERVFAFLVALLERL